MKNTITPAHIDDLFASSTLEVVKLGEKTTVVAMTLPNGFVMVTSSSCVDPVNYDQEIGERCCHDHLKERLWELEGYNLQNKLYLESK